LEFIKMSVLATDLVIYGAANIAEADGNTQGGAIDTTVRYIFDSASLVNTTGPDTVDVVSDDAGDTGITITITGRDAAGAITTDNYTLQGVSEQTGSTTFSSIMKIVMSGAAAGTINVHENSGSQTIVDIEPGVTEIRIPFYNVAADASGGSSRDFYEKVFFKNNNGSSDLLSAAVDEQADPSTYITFDLEDAQDDNNSVATRLDTPPSGMLGAFDSSSKNVPGTDLAAGSAIGVWLKLTLAAGTSASSNTYTIRLEGSTT
jgi:hypothetical protein